MISKDMFVKDQLAVSPNYKLHTTYYTLHTTHNKLRTTHYTLHTTPDMEFVKKFTQARFLKTKFYPKVRKSQWTQDRDKTA